jgi:hypothetical protein
MQLLSFSLGNVLFGSLASRDFAMSRAPLLTMGKSQAKTNISNISTRYGIVSTADNDSSRKMRYLDD